MKAERRPVAGRRGAVFLAVCVVATALASPDWRPAAAEKITRVDDWFVVGNAEFRIDPREDEWVRVPSGTFGDDDSLMEFAGRTKGTWAVVYDFRGRLSLNEVVRQRQSLIRPEVDSLETEETRSLLPDSSIPVSYARHSGSLRGRFGNGVWWAATIVTETGGVEILASTAGAQREQMRIEWLVKSLRARLRDTVE